MSITNENVARIWALLKAGEEMIGSTRVDKAILIVGKSGSGKTTLTHFLTGNNTDLVSEELETGDFIIIRNDNEKIIHENNTTAVSKTLPKLIHDRETKIIYIECPEFTDGDPNDDIAAAYFTKKVIENVKNIKIVMTVNYSSFRSGSDGEDIRNLVERVITLMKNIDVDSVALVVTEVDNKYKKGVLVPDHVVNENIAKFLLKVKESLKSDSNVHDKNLVFDNSRRLFDALVQKNATEYSRLGIFRRPDAVGLISEIKLLQDEKKNLSEMLENNLKYAQVDSINVGYTVSDKSKNIIRDRIEEVGKSIAADVSQIKDMLIDYFKQLEIDLFDDDIYAVQKHLEAASAILSKIRGISKSAKASELVSSMENYFTESWIRASEPILNDMKKLGELMDFLQDMSGKQFDSFALKWVGELDDAVFYVENSLKWYNFVVVLYERLSEHDVQKDTKRLPIPKFQNFSSGYGLLENHADFSKFYSMISNHRLLGDHYFKELQKVTIDEIKVRYFDKVIESTLLRPPPEFSMFYDQGPRLQVSGEYVKISDVVQYTGYSESKSVQVIATHAVFIDANMTKENDISIIAPRWVIIDFRQINLNGSPGEEWIPYKAPNGLCSGCSGKNGLPGKPGNSAGVFFGIGDEFENASQLQIQAIGGTGGNAQFGGDGGNGAPGSTHYLRKGTWNLECPEGQKCYTRVSEYSKTFCNDYVIAHNLYGSPGERGGDAGRGGAPGVGGFAGNITIIGVGIKKPSISQKVKEGNDGEFGLHGTCGEGGEGGYTRVSKSCLNCDSPDQLYDDEKSPNGDKGVCLYVSSLENSNVEGRANPATVNFLYPPASTISDSRNKLVKNFDNCVQKPNSIKFYTMLQKEEILKSYDSIELILSEFRQLERLYNTFTPDLSKSLYKSMLRRIEDISKQPDYSSNTENTKFLELLSSAVVNKLIRLEKNSHARLMFNHREYFDALKTVDLGTISRYFADRTLQEINRTEDVVKIVSSDIFHTIEDIISEISGCSSEDLQKLERQLLKLKLFSTLKSVNEFLDLITSLAKGDLNLIQTMRIENVLPSVEISLSAIDASMINTKLAAIKKVTEKEIYAIDSTILNEIRSLKPLGDEFDPIIDQLLDVEANLRTRWTIIDKSNEYSMFFNVSDEINAINSINSGLLKNFGPKVNESVVNFEKSVRVIQWNVDLYDALLAKADFYIPSLTSSIDNIRQNYIHFDETARDVLHWLEPVLSTTKISVNGDLYNPENLQGLRVQLSHSLGELKSKIRTLVAEFGTDKDFPSIVENFDEVLNQLVSMFDEVLPGEHNRALLNNLHSQLQLEEEPDNLVQNYFSKITGADKLFYEYENLIDSCKTSIFPFNILTNRRLAFPATPHVSESSFQHWSTVASNIERLEAEFDSWEQRIKNVTTAEDFNSDNENGAFFVWRNKHHKDSISKLLRGRAVVLKASLDVVGDKWQWLTFDNIGLRFVSSISAVQQSLDEDLKYFNVSMTHMGDSHFSLCNRDRLVHHDATQFNHSFNETTTRVIDPVKSSLKPVLSPFATWIFKLHPIDEDVTFSVLNPYRKLDISIELEGNATFVDSVNRTMCQKIVLSDFDIHQLPSRLENDQEIAKNASGVDQPSSTTLANSSVANQLISSTESSSASSDIIEASSSAADEFLSRTESSSTYSNIIESSTSAADQPPPSKKNAPTDDSIAEDDLVTSVEDPDSTHDFDSSENKSTQRKRRDIDSSGIAADNQTFNWSNPFNYFFNAKSDPKLESPSNAQFLGQVEDQITKHDYCQFFNVNGTLALVDFFVRKITKIKPCQSMEKSVSVEEARVIALNIIEELENMSRQLPEEEHFSLSSGQDKDPVELMCQLEKCIFAGDLSKMKNILVDLIPLDVYGDELDSLLERHLSCAGIQRSDANSRVNLPDGRGHLSGVLKNDFIDQGVIPLMVTENLNVTSLN